MRPDGARHRTKAVVMLACSFWLAACTSGAVAGSGTPPPTMQPVTGPESSRTCTLITQDVDPFPDNLPFLASHAQVIVKAAYSGAVGAATWNTADGQLAQAASGRPIRGSRLDTPVALKTVESLRSSIPSADAVYFPGGSDADDCNVYAYRNPEMPQPTAGDRYVFLLTPRLDPESKPLPDLVIIAAWPIDASTGDANVGGGLTPADVSVLLKDNPYAGPAVP